MNFFVSVVAALVLSCATSAMLIIPDPEFQEYIQKYNKLYSGKEYMLRKERFHASLSKVKAHDSRKGWTLAINEFSDLTEEEFQSKLGYARHAANLPGRLGRHVPFHLRLAVPLKESLDWREQGIITSVKNQGGCGSCWTFAAASTIESWYAKKTGQLHVLSEQNILDCVPNPKECGGTGGCFGGTAELAFETLAEQGGIADEWTYPYISYFGENQTCKKNVPAKVKLTGYRKLETNNEEDLVNALNLGPIAISVDASSWSEYSGGIFDGCNQTTPDVNHAVQLVGYGHEQVGDELVHYWLVRNSWGPGWGEKGYIRLKRMKGEESKRCGMDINPLDGVACKGDDLPVKVCGTCGILFDSSYPTL